MTAYTVVGEHRPRARRYPPTLGKRNGIRQIEAPRPVESRGFCPCGWRGTLTEDHGTALAEVRQHRRWVREHHGTAS